METELLGTTIGLEIRGVDCSRSGLTGQVFQEIHQAFLEFKVICLKDQILEPQEQIEFTKRFGTISGSGKHNSFAVPAHPEITILTNKKSDGKPVGFDRKQTDEWHTDITFMKQPSMMAVLYGLQTPDTGGTTPFADLGAAYEALSNDVKHTISGLRGIHAFPEAYGGKLTKEQAAAMPPVTHPMVRTHPETGQKSIFVSPMMTVGVEGMDEPASQDLLQMLFTHSIDPRFVYTHKWSPRDVLIWDNRGTMHRSTPFDETQIRYMHRTMVNGDTPF